MNRREQVKLPQFQDRAESVLHQFMQALPVIVFFLVMFYTVIFLFGMEYTMVVSLGTLIFQVNYRKKTRPGTLVYIAAQQLFLLVLAFTATWNLALCLILNLTVPFWLIFSKASAFNQLGYFSSLMTFTFMQMMPVDWEGFLTQFAAMALCCLCVLAAVPLYSFVTRKPEQPGTERKAA